MENSIKYIFCISTGRSGSDYLAKLFRHASACCSLHEPEPIGNGQPMRQYLQGKVETMHALARRKVLAINEAKGENQIYVETNHCFIKGYGWYMPSLLPENRIGVIILNRDKAKIAHSYMRIGFSPLTQAGRDWVMTPSMRNPLVPPPMRLFSPIITYKLALVIKFVFRCLRVLSRAFIRREFKYPFWFLKYELDCFEWYVEETQAQTQKFKLQFPKIRYYEIEISALNSMESVRNMFSFFNCTEKSSLLDVVGKSTNLKHSDPLPAKS